MKKYMGKMKKGALALSVFALTCAAHAEGEVAAMATDLTATAGEVATAVGSVVAAGFVIFGIVWGARKLKGAISSAG